ncbi:MAG: 16S rRNA (guanine(527)-N(7))-methyltransferase RsmG [Solirubrobacteraceae bacterium]|nr:16S rRNA (guanine(527)-N(7))-methyltransferase RsmG [Solirubrobacteraceae bacterium]
MTAESRLEALVARFGLDPSLVGPLGAYLELLANDPTAPTTVTDPARAIDEHLADAYVALELPEVRDAHDLADLGSGAGVPGLPLALALPGARVSLVDSLERKGAFMRRAVEVTGATNVDVVVARAEAWPEGVGAHDVILARAVAPLAVLAEYAAPLLREGGSLVAWKGQPDAEEHADAEFAAEVLGLAWEERHAVTPWKGAKRLSLYVARKIAPTPDRFPRREGMARKKQLRAPSAGAN